MTLSTFGNQNADPSPAGERTMCTVRAIVPFLDEQDALPGALERLRRAGVDRIVAVDGGSTDRSVALARAGADEVRSSRLGLAAQLNHGASGSTEEVLLFVYADVELAPDFRREITRVLSEPAAVGGAFSLRLAGSAPHRGRAIRGLIAGGANLRTRLGIGPFGDQAIFVRRTAFERIGGYRSGPILEDLDLVRRLRRLGRVVVSPSPVRASARRWERDGFLRTTALHWWALGRHLAGARRASDGSCALDRVRTGGR